MSEQELHFGGGSIVNFPGRFSGVFMGVRMVGDGTMLEFPCYKLFFTSVTLNKNLHQDCASKEEVDMWAIELEDFDFQFPLSDIFSLTRWMKKL